jgi:NADH:ubiquinone oxidoreductase subunit B-like Fe-S oxidoreductase
MLTDDVTVWIQECEKRFKSLTEGFANLKIAIDKEQSLKRQQQQAKREEHDKRFREAYSHR